MAYTSRQQVYAAQSSSQTNVADTAGSQRREIQQQYFHSLEENKNFLKPNTRSSPIITGTIHTLSILTCTAYR